MSWSVGTIGKAEAVRKTIADQFSRSGACAEPEETIRQTAAALIDKALESTDPSFVVEVNASGSQSYKDWTAKTGVSNYLSITIQPKHGFVE